MRRSPSFFFPSSNPFSVSNVAATAVAVARVRGARAARVMVARTVDLALNDDAIAAVTVMAGYQKSEQAGDEEEDAVHDAERKRRLEHGALPVNVQIVTIARDGKEAQVLAVLATGRNAGAVRIRNTAEAVDAADESADEEQVDESNEFGRVSCARVQEKRAHCPRRTKYRNDEEHQDGARREKVALVEPGNEPGEHAQRGDQRDDLEDAPEDERKP